MANHDVNPDQGWTKEGLEWHMYLLDFAQRYGKSPVSSQSPVAYLDELLTEVIRVLEAYQTMRFMRGHEWWGTQGKPLLDKIKNNEKSDFKG